MQEYLTVNQAYKLLSDNSDLEKKKEGRQAIKFHIKAGNLNAYYPEIFTKKENGEFVFLKNSEELFLKKSEVLLYKKQKQQKKGKGVELVKGSVSKKFRSIQAASDFLGVNYHRVNYATKHPQRQIMGYKIRKL